MQTMGPNGGGPDVGAMAGGGMGMGGGMQQQQMQRQGQMQSQMQKQMAQQGKMAGPGAMAPGAGPAAAGGTGDSTADSGPADFHSPEGAVRSFLNALKARDQDRLSESTAQRASSEIFGASTTKNREIFKKIIDLSLSDSELDDLAKKLDGYTIAGENPPKSTKRVEVIIAKQSGNSKYSRKVTVLLEKKGWGVLDIEGATVFKPMPGMRPVRKSGRGY